MQNFLYRKWPIRCWVMGLWFQSCSVCWECSAFLGPCSSLEDTFRYRQIFKAMPSQSSLDLCSALEKYDFYYSCPHVPHGSGHGRDASDRPRSDSMSMSLTLLAQKSLSKALPDYWNRCMSVTGEYQSWWSINTKEEPVWESVYAGRRSNWHNA